MGNSLLVNLDSRSSNLNIYTMQLKMILLNRISQEKLFHPDRDWQFVSGKHKTYIEF